MKYSYTKWKCVLFFKQTGLTKNNDTSILTSVLKPGEKTKQPSRRRALGQNGGQPVCVGLSVSLFDPPAKPDRDKRGKGLNMIRRVLKDVRV